MTVREKGLEPSRLSAPEPKSGVYTNFTTPARLANSNAEFGRDFGAEAP